MNGSSLAIGVIGALALASASRGSRARRTWDSSELADYLREKLMPALSRLKRGKWKVMGEKFIDCNILENEYEDVDVTVYLFYESSIHSEDMSIQFNLFDETWWAGLPTRRLTLGGERCVWTGVVEEDIKTWWSLLQPILKAIETGDRKEVSWALHTAEGLATSRLGSASKIEKPAYDPHQDYVLHGKDIDVTLTGALDGGLGSTSVGSNVEYLGWVAWLTPRQFLRINPPRLESHFKMVPFLKAGEKIAMPFLDVALVAPDLAHQDLEDLPENTHLTFQVRGHEGRGRMIAISELVGSDVLVPVAILPRQGYRARHFRPDLIAGATLQSDPRTSARSTVTLGKFAWQGHLYEPEGSRAINKNKR